MHNELRTRESKKAAKLLFLAGLFSQTQLHLSGNLGISELCMVVCAPFILMNHIALFRRLGALTFIWLGILWFFGACFSDFWNHTFFAGCIRGIAVPVTIVCNTICLLYLLQKDVRNLKYFLVGVACSAMLSIFVFQRGRSGLIADEYGLMAGASAVMGYKLFWVNTLTTWMTLPVKGWYLTTPFGYMMTALCFLCVFNLMSGGRSAFLTALGSLFLVLIGKKRRQTMSFIKKNFILVAVLSAGVLLLARFSYKYAATSGLMGAEELKKYEQQSEETKGSVMKLLAKGRQEFFIGLLAALDHPLVGFGSHAVDQWGYVESFVTKYGSESDVERFYAARRYQMSKGQFYCRLPAHSHIIHYWMWHGIFGLLFWLYAFYLLIITLIKRMGTYPPYFGFLAIFLPQNIWDFLFSPLGLRVDTSMFFAVCLIVRAIQLRRIQVPEV